VDVYVITIKRSLLTFVKCEKPGSKLQLVDMGYIYFLPKGSLHTHITVQLTNTAQRQYFQTHQQI